MTVWGRRVAVGVAATIAAGCYSYSVDARDLSAITGRPYPAIGQPGPAPLYEFCMDGTQMDFSDLPPGWKCANPAVDLIDVLIQRVGGCESGWDPYGPLLNIENKYGSSASGPWQILDSTFRSWEASFAPELHYRRAIDAPVDVQRAIVRDELETVGTSPWNESKRCWR